MPHLNSGFPGMAAPAKALQIAQNIGQFRVRSDGLDMIHLQPPTLTAGHTGPAVTVQRLHPHRLPTRPACDLC